MKEGVEYNTYSELTYYHGMFLNYNVHGCATLHSKENKS